MQIDFHRCSFTHTILAALNLTTLQGSVMCPLLINLNRVTAPFILIKRLILSFEQLPSYTSI